MSTPGPFGGFEGMPPFFKDLAKMFAAQGPLNWDFARQWAQWVATEGESEGNVDPLARIRVEELARVADLHVAEVTGLSTSSTGRALSLVPVGRGEWAMRTLDAWAPLLEKLAHSLGQSASLAPEDTPAETADLLGGLTQFFIPVLMGGQAGSMVGHLSRRVFGQYDLPIPRPPSDELLVVGTNLEAFAADWSLPLDDVRLWVCLSEITHHAVVSRPHVRARLLELLESYAGAFRPDADALEAQFGQIDPANPDSFNQVLGDPGALLGAMQSDEQRRLAPQLEALVAAIEGYVDWVVDTAGHRLVSSYGPLTEALRRQRVARGDGDKLVEQMFGLELGQAQYDRGAAFVRGVVERAGEDGLHRLWRSDRELPTPAEVDAPGLWLARIELD